MRREDPTRTFLDLGARCVKIHNKFMSKFEPIRITGIVEKEVSKPRNDRTPGSALYNVPFQLSALPPAEWARYFPKAWDHPSSWSSAHRPGICEVVGDRIWLNGTTLEEVAKTHQSTLQLSLDETNGKYAEFEAQQRTEADRKRKEQEGHEQHVREVAKKIKFD
jgi:hypothetical protein